MKAKYDRIGIDYNETRKADPYIVDLFYKYLAPNPTDIFADIGCGTGNYTSALAQRGYSFIGVDPSEQMLNQARSRSTNIQWLQGSAERIPLEDHSVDGVMGMLTIHHWSNLTNGLSEIHRIIKPNGRLVIFTSTSEQMKGYWLNHYFPQMMQDSIDQMPTWDQIKKSFTQAGWKLERQKLFHIQKHQIDLFLYAGKENPNLYLNESVRRGISSFSDLAYDDEVSTGLKQLRLDILSGEFNNVTKRYQHHLGDYMFVAAN